MIEVEDSVKLPMRQQLQAGFIVGHSLLMARGIPCAGEGDL